MNSRTPLLSKDQLKLVSEWWYALQPREEGKRPPTVQFRGLGRADRARLKRCIDLVELSADPATLRLAGALIEPGGSSRVLADTQESYRRVALIAGIVAGVAEDKKDSGGVTFAKRLGIQPGGDSRAMGELRFKRLQKSDDPDDLLRQMRRAVQLAGKIADVAMLADDLLAWQIELVHPERRRGNGVRFQWAYDYYLSAREQSAAEDVNIPAEIAS